MPKQNHSTETLMNEYLKALNEINLGFPEEEANYLTLK